MLRMQHTRIYRILSDMPNYYRLFTRRLLEVLLFHVQFTVRDASLNIPTESNMCQQTTC